MAAQTVKSSSLVVVSAPGRVAHAVPVGQGTSVMQGAAQAGPVLLARQAPEAHSLSLAHLQPGSPGHTWGFASRLASPLSSGVATSSAVSPTLASRSVPSLPPRRVLSKSPPSPSISLTASPVVPSWPGIPLSPPASPVVTSEACLTTASSPQPLASSKEASRAPVARAARGKSVAIAQAPGGLCRSPDHSEPCRLSVTRLSSQASSGHGLAAKTKVLVVRERAAVLHHANTIAPQRIGKRIVANTEL